MSELEEVERLASLLSDVPGRVTAGAAWLDRVKPGWATLVNPDAIDLDSPHDCILGQVFAPEAEANGWSSGWGYVTYTWTDDPNRGQRIPVRDTRDLGFNTGEGPLESEARVTVWRDAIAQRMAGESE
jgi:hypothetical protein